MHEERKLKIVIVGHVDHGKSTLIGRLFYDTDSIPQSRVDEIRATCDKQGREFEYAYLMDALEEEREQNVTIDTAQTFFKTDKRQYVIIDAPGHKEFLKNMITGAASADAAVLLLDGVEGVREQTRRHAYLLSLLGIRQVLVAVNKLDMADYSEKVFREAENQIRAHLHGLGIVPTDVVPISARDGENVVHRRGFTPWYSGPTIIDALDAFSVVREEEALPFRFPVQDVYKWDNRRIYVGRIETGSVKVGDDVTFIPSGRRTKVKTIEKFQEPDLRKSSAGESVGFTFTDEIFVERGELLAHSDRLPIASQELTASLFWLSKKTFRKGNTYTLKLTTAEVEAVCVDILERLDSSTLDIVEKHADVLEPTEAGNVVFALKSPIAADAYLENLRTGRFVVEDGAAIGGGGIIRDILPAEGSEKAQVIDLDRHFTTEPHGNLVDLSREAGELEFLVSDSFLRTLGSGEKLWFKLRGPGQVEHVAKLAFEHHLDFTFSREKNGANIVLFKHKRSATPTSEPYYASLP